jgi:molybdenum cofactor synthesis domain-containing protein
VILRAQILTISDSVHYGIRADVTGPAIAVTLENHGFDVVGSTVVPDGVHHVMCALRIMCTGFEGVVITTGGTGFSPTDTTPEATRRIVDREAPGLAEAMRASNPLGRLSRGVAGMVGPCLIVNVPGSRTGALESIESIIDVLPHAMDLLTGGRPH